MTTTLNLGLVKLVHVSTTPPVNINMIWYDDNIGIKQHKYYDTVTSNWVLLGSGILAKRGVIDPIWYDSDDNLVIPHNLGKWDIYVSIKDSTGITKSSIPYKSIDVNNVKVFTGEIITGEYAVVCF